MRRIGVLVLLMAALVAGLAAASAANATTIRSIALPGEPRAGVMAGDDLWILLDRGDERRLVEVRPDGRAPSSVVRVRKVRDILVAQGVPPFSGFQASGSPRPSLTVAGGFLWTIDPVSRTVVRVRIADGGVERTGVGADYVAVGPAGLWAAATANEFTATGVLHPVLRLDPATGTVVERRTVGPGLGGGTIVELAVGVDRLWLALPGGGRNGAGLDLSAGTFSRLEGGSWQFFARAGTLVATRRSYGDVYVTTGTAARPIRLAMAGDDRPYYPRDAALGAGGRVWAVYAHRAAPGLLVERRIGSGAPAIRTRVGADPVDLVPSGRAVWVLDRTHRRATLIR